MVLSLCANIGVSFCSNFNWVGHIWPLLLLGGSRNLEFNKSKSLDEFLKIIYNILKRIPQNSNLYHMGFELLCSLSIYHRRGKAFPLRNSSRKEKNLQGIIISLVPTVLLAV